MARYLIRRLATLPLVLLGVLLAVFLMLHLSPGDPVAMLVGVQDDQKASQEVVARIRQELGLDRPLYAQFGTFVWRVVQGDLGKSIKSQRPVATEIMTRMPATLELAMASILVAMLIGVPLGIVSGSRRGSWFDRTSMVGALAGVCMPSFWLGYLLMLLFGLYLGWLPTSGRAGPFYEWAGLMSLVLPALTLGAGSAGILARLTRSSMQEVLRMDFIRTARAKGLAERVVIYRHALKNALIPVVTVLGLQFGWLLGGAVIVEAVFSWPGIGRLMVTGISSRDYPVVQSSVIVIAAMFVLVNTMTDILYRLVDPRIKT
jgi:peptide/nickel transport system permease protein